MIVWPSGGDFTTTSVPIVPEAPGRFSTKKGWSQRAWSLGASRRATMSGPAAGVNGTMIRTGRLDIPWASAPSSVKRSGEGAPAQQLQGLGPLGHDVRDGVGDQFVGFLIFHLADRRGEAELSDEKLVPQAGGVDIVGQAGPVLERKA